MKWCSGCDKDKPDEKFAWRKVGISRQSRCKKCQREAGKAHYENNKDYYKAKAKTSRPALRERGKTFIIEYLLIHPCIDCGQSDIEVLEFDHVVPLNDCKAPRVSTLVERPIKRIMEEIDKCVVRCSDCHTRRTRRLAGTLRLH